MVSEGQDDLGKFQVHVPGLCEVCVTNQSVDVVVVYNSMSLKRSLGRIDPASTIIAQPGKPIKHIGVTCGCYAKFHRQVAHIKEALEKKGRSKNL